MKDEIIHAKLPGEAYKKLKRESDMNHRTLHSLVRHVLILYSEGKLVEKEKQ